jgi:hypothetical protein
VSESHQDSENSFFVEPSFFTDSLVILLGIKQAWLWCYSYKFSFRWVFLVGLFCFLFGCGCGCLGFLVVSLFGCLGFVCVWLFGVCCWFFVVWLCFVVGCGVVLFSGGVAKYVMLRLN